MKNPFDAQDLDTWPTTSTVPSPLERTIRLPLMQQVQEEGDLEEMGRLGQVLRELLGEVKTAVERMTDLETHLRQRESPYAFILDDAHDEICPEEQVERLRDWLNTIEQAWGAETSALSKWRAQADVAPW